MLDSIKCPRSINAHLLWWSNGPVAQHLLMGYIWIFEWMTTFIKLLGFLLTLRCCGTWGPSFLINCQSLIDICVQMNVCGIYSGICGICLVFSIRMYSVFGQMDSEVEWCIVMVQMSSNEPNEWWRCCWCAERSCSCWVQHGWHRADGNR